MTLKAIHRPDITRIQKIRSFKVVQYSGNVLEEFIPTDEAKRADLYATYYDEGIKLPPYDSFERRALRKRDMKVVARDWYMVFDYCGRRYRIEVKKGGCYDGASVPVPFVLGNVSKFNSYVTIPAIVHDCLFALKLFSYEDSNNIFSALLRWNKINKLALARYMAGVRSPVGRRIYKKGKAEEHWLNGFVCFKEYY